MCNLRSTRHALCADCYGTKITLMQSSWMDDRKFGVHKMLFARFFIAQNIHWVDYKLHICYMTCHKKCFILLQIMVYALINQQSSYIQNANKFLSRFFLIKTCQTSKCASAHVNRIFPTRYRFFPGGMHVTREIPDSVKRVTKLIQGG